MCKTQKYLVVTDVFPKHLVKKKQDALCGASCGVSRRYQYLLWRVYLPQIALNRPLSS